jgi:hypothetical protein
MCFWLRFAFELYVTPLGYREKIMETHTQGGALLTLGFPIQPFQGVTS